MPPATRTKMATVKSLSALACHSLLSGALAKECCIQRGADKSLTRPGRKQATATEYFDFHMSYL